MTSLCNKFYFMDSKVYAEICGGTSSVGVPRLAVAVSDAVENPDIEDFMGQILEQLNDDTRWFS